MVSFLSPNVLLYFYYAQTLIGFLILKQNSTSYCHSGACVKSRNIQCKDLWNPGNILLLAIANMLIRTVLESLTVASTDELHYLIIHLLKIFLAIDR